MLPVSLAGTTLLDPINIAVLIVAITNAIYGMVVYARDRRDPINFSFFMLTLAVSAWGFSMFAYRGSGDELFATLFARMLYVSAILIPYSFIYFVLRMTKQILPKEYNLLLALPVIVLCYLSLDPHALISGVTILPSEENIIWFNQNLHLSYGIYIVVYFIVGYILLAKQWLHSRGVERIQLSYVFIGTVAATTIGIITNLILPYLGIFYLNWAGQVGSIVMITAIFYAILRHHLFHVNVIATEVLIFVLWTFVLIRVLTTADPQELIGNTVLLILAVGTGILLIRSVLKEVTQRERLEKLTHDLEAANARLKTLDQQKSEFLGIAAHQLRSPIATIKGYTSLILEGSYGRVTKKMYEPVQTMFEVASRMADSIDEFLNISRIEQGRMEYKKERKSIEELVEKMVHMYEAAATEKHLALTLEKINCTHETHLVDVDVAKLDHVLNNLIDNAIKYTPHGSVTVRIVCADAERKIRVSVSDTGGGIPPEALPELFNKFVRAANARKMDVSGSGLGLYLARQIIEAHGGKIWAESTGEGKGSTFAFELPLATA